jgi:16S rRNA (cytidine1402-2'-O)-methyltransferase
LKNKLFVVSSPIGNLKDITLRAIETLKEVSFIACEDTRVTSILLNHFEIRKELVSLHSKNESARLDYIIERINNGETCALISDAGTPGISDPGVRLISAAINNEIDIVPVPGVTAAIAALTISGLPTDSFIFEGFLPQKKGRQKKIKELSNEERTIIIYESTYRIEKFLKELNDFMPDRYLVVCRELTKKFEEVWRGKPLELLADFPEKIIKGEFVIVISPKNWRLNHSEL